MKMRKSILILTAFVLCATSVMGQRRNQIEFYGGANIPLSPDEFKDYAKVGLSGNAQYVLFPSPRLGITVNAGYEFFSTDNEKFADGLSTELTGFRAREWVDAGFQIDPTAEVKVNIFRFGAGVRPYLTDPEASTQIFLLGQANYNIIQNDFTANELPVEFNPFTQELFVLTFDDETYEEQFEENDDNVFGIGAGAGLEIPAGESFNIVLQGLFNILFTEDESTSFVGVTAGLVF